MKAEGLTLGFMTGISVFEIPFFQRGYVWKEENWKEMLETFSRNDINQFLGSIIIQSKSLTPPTCSIIDGQQRLTTLSILIKAIYDSLDDTKKKNTYGTLLNYLFYKKNALSDQYYVKLNHSKIDAGYFNTVIGTIKDDKITTMDDATYSSINKDSSLIFQCYKYFRESLKKYDDNAISILFSNIFDKKMLVVITLESMDNEQQIFDTINSAGIKLTCADIIKNALYQKLIDLSGGDKDYAYKKYEDTWFSTFCYDDDKLKYWSSEKSIGRYKRDYLEILLQAIAIIKEDPNNPGKSVYDVWDDQLKDLADKYKMFINTLNKSQLEDFIDEIMEYAEIYRKHIPVIDNTTPFEFDNMPARLAHILTVSENTTFTPYILYLYKTYDEDSEKLSSRLRDLEKMVIAYLITKESNKNFNKYCSMLIKTESESDTAYDNYFKTELYIFDNQKLLDGLKYIKSNKIASLILFWIELNRRYKDTKFDTKILQYNYQLEHIMPQKWEANWKSVPYVDGNNNPITDDLEGNKNRYNFVYSLGNMTLLNGKLNASISNNTFIKKIDKDGKSGIDHYSSLSITKDDIIKENYEVDKTWNEYKIKQREIKLGNEFLEIWGN